MVSITISFSFAEDVFAKSRSYGSSGKSSSYSKSSSSSNEIFFDPEVNVYYDSKGIVVDPDGKHSQSVGSRYSDLREYRDRWERGEPVMV